MIDFKKYIASQLIGKRLHFSCHCILPFDEIGVIKDYIIENNRIIYIIDIKGKMINIDENHPNLIVEEL